MTTMQQSIQRLAIALLLTTVCGCQWSSIFGRKEPVHVDPALPMTMSRDELVEYINGQILGLESWRCTHTKMKVRTPGIPQQKLSGSIACQAPRHFHLRASNVVAHADLGSNAERCWLYVQPGEPAVATWKHEDTALLQHIPSGVPYIDPNWLMMVVGVKPLNAEDYVLSENPPLRELWLNASERSPEGRDLRRVIKVDTVRGVVHEHTVYDDQSNVLVRARLSEHKPFQGHVLPTSVKLEFPQMESEIALTFGDIETNPRLPEALWIPPRGKSLEVRDLGEELREELRRQGFVLPDPAPESQPFSHSPSIRLQQPRFEEPSASMLSEIDVSPGRDAWPGHDLAEPEWDTGDPFSDDEGVIGAGHSSYNFSQ